MAKLSRHEIPANKPGRPKTSRDRPKRLPKVANIIQDLLNQSVPVREGETTQHMPSCEAMMRMQVRKALNGDTGALQTIMSLLDMMGQMDEPLDEVRQRLYLPDAMSMDEWDLLQSPAREIERQKYAAMADDELPPAASKDGRPEPPLWEEHLLRSERTSGSGSKEPAAQAATRPSSSAEMVAALADGDDIALGNLRAADGDLDGALAAYRRGLAELTSKLAKDDDGAKAGVREAAVEIGLMASRFIRVGRFATALECVDQSIELDAGNISYHAIRAQALMFLGRIADARSVFLKLQGHTDVAGRTWEANVLDGFVELRESGHTHPLMDEIEAQFGRDVGASGRAVAAGTGSRLRSSAGGADRDEGLTGRIKPDATGDTLPFIDEPDEIKAGDALVAQGKLDEAADRYIRYIGFCKANVGKNASDRTAQAGLALTVGRLVELTFGLLLARNYNKTIMIAEQAVSRLPNCTRLHAVLAHAYMLGANITAAKKLYTTYWGKSIDDGEAWNNVVRKDFAELRKAGFAHPLMAEIEG